MAYLDSAATSQTPGRVIERLHKFLASEHANIHRGAYQLSAAATDNYELSREAVAKFLGAPTSREIVFTRGTTEGINLVAYALEDWFKPGDTILLTLLEHHSNIVPWQLLAERKKLRLSFADIKDDATIDVKDLKSKIENERPRLLAITYVSNAFGTAVPLPEIIEFARARGARVLVDAAQAVAHMPVNVAKLGADFLAFSGHKVFGPTGIGVLYARQELLELMKPFQGGGGMIRTVTTEGSTWADIPHKFEAGTPPIAEAIALKEAIDFVESLGWDEIARHEKELFTHLYERLKAEEGVTVYGPESERSIIAFNLKDIHAHDLATVADSFNVQLRAGHHCALPALTRLGLAATARASLAVYNTPEDIDALMEALRYAKKMFKGK